LVDAIPSKLPQYNALLEKAIVAMDKLTGILAEVTPLYAAIGRDANALKDPSSGNHGAGRSSFLAGDAAHCIPFLWACWR